jgi:hypothetical protein
MPRMKILNSVEREVFDWPPIFNSVERKRCFDFPTPLQDIATSLRHGGQSVGLSLELRLFQGHQAILPGPDFPSTRPHVRRRSDRRGARWD